MKKMIWFLTFAVSATAFAGKFEVIGEGTSSRPAEFIRVDIRILSECHSQALTARQTVDGLTQKALDVLQRFKADLPEQIGVSPEGNQQKIKTGYVNNEQVTICDENHSWNSSTMIQFKLNDQQKLAELQDALLGLNVKALPANAINKERLSLSLSQPTPGVFASTWDEMSDLALKRAHQNALRQVKALTEGNAATKTELVKVTSASVGSSGQLIYDRVDAEGDTSSRSLGQVSLKLARQFTFKVE